MADGDTVVPMMGFHEEQHIPGFRTKEAGSSGWTDFYTCICNGKRVFVWAYRNAPHDHDDHNSCCVMVRDSFDPGYKAGISEIQHMFAEQHTRQRERGVRRTHYASAEPLLLQAFIHEVTRGGNDKWPERDFK